MKQCSVLFVFLFISCPLVAQDAPIATKLEGTTEQSATAEKQAADPIAVKLDAAKAAYKIEIETAQERLLKSIDSEI